MNTIWEDIERRLAGLNWGVLLSDLQGPVTTAGLVALAGVRGRSVPTSLIEYLRIHDGSAGRYRLLEPWELLPAAGIVETVRFMGGEFRALLLEKGIHLEDEQEARGPVRPVIWHDDWWPFADDGSGGLLCVDNDPAAGGRRGQVILWSADPPYVEVVMPSLESLFEQYGHDVSAGRYGFRADEGVSRNW